MRFLIWGAGAIGGTLGAYLARAGHDVTWVDVAAEHVAAIDRAGLHITGPIAEFTAHAPAFTPAAVAGEWDTIILATKAQHTAEAAHALLPHLGPSGCVVSAQNGLNELVIAEIAGPERTVGAFVNFGADYIEPGVIHYGGRGAVVVGEIDGRVTPRVEAIRQAWLDFDDRAIATDNIWGYLWGKEAYGAMLFATALTNDSIADALARPEVRGLYIALAQEILAVAAAAASRPRHSTASTRLPTCPARPGRGEPLAGRAGRVQPALGQDPQRHLARPGRAEAPHRGGCADRHHRDAGRAGRHPHAPHRPAGGADPRHRGRHQAAGARDAGTAQRRPFQDTDKRR